MLHAVKGFEWFDDPACVCIYSRQNRQSINLPPSLTYSLTKATEFPDNVYSINIKDPSHAHLGRQSSPDSVPYLTAA